jgi:hypothetical protein
MCLIIIFCMNKVRQDLLWYYDIKGPHVDVSLHSDTLLTA